MKNRPPTPDFSSFLNFMALWIEYENVGLIILHKDLNHKSSLLIYMTFKLIIYITTYQIWRM